MTIEVTRILSQLMSDEGYRSMPYLCTAGVWTIGYGATSWNGVPVNVGTPRVSLSAAIIELKSNVLDCMEEATQLYSTFDSYPARLQEILVMLVFQLGRTRLSKFVRMNEAIRSMDLRGWAREIEDSRLYRQATNRINRYLVTIKTSPSYV